jgi:hypothetical protein
MSVVAEDTPNSGVPSVQAPSVSSRTPTPRLKLADPHRVANGMKTPSSAGGISARGGKPIAVFLAPPKPLEEILINARQVDSLVNAIHSEATADYTGRLKQAYKALSKGLNLPGTEEGCLDSTTKQVQASARRPDFSHADRRPAQGVVPGIVSSPPRDPNRPSRTSMAASHEARKAKANACREPFVTSSLAPPWGADRANLDRPPLDQVHRRQKNYCRILDEQNADKFDRVKHKYEQEIEIDRTTHTSFETAHHIWGQQAGDAGRERAIFREHLATVNYKAQTARDRLQTDRQDSVIAADQAEKQMAWQWHMKREEEKQEKERLVAAWQGAAKDRRRGEEAQRAASLREEKDAIQRVNQGKIPARRVRRPKEECFSSRDAYRVADSLPASVAASILSPIKPLPGARGRNAAMTPSSR